SVQGNKMKKRVLMVHNFYQTGGGEHTVFKNETELLQQEGHFVKVYTKDNSCLKGNFLKLLTVPLSTLFSLGTYLDVKKIIKEEKIDIVHCHNTFPLISPSVYYAAWSCKVPVVQTVHNFRFVCANGLLYRNGKICEDCLNGGCKAINHGCYRNSKVQTIPVVAMQKLHSMLGTYKRLNYIFLTEFNKNKIMPKLDIKGKVFIKPNFVKKTEIIANIVVDKNKFIFVGRLDEYKGIEFLLEFFSEHKEYTLCIYGEGSLEEKVKSFSKKYENIRYMGFKPHEEMEQDWQSSCALIFSSLLYETMGMTVVESMARGVPIICTSIGNPANIVNDGNAGVHFEMKNSDSLAKAIEKIQIDRNYYSQNAAEAAKKYYKEENYIKLCSIYDEI
ncbi:MAG: glycosyltransferase family 4 protein, partial [Oscillospiraceae bacterium]